MPIPDPQKYIQELEQKLIQSEIALHELEFLNKLFQRISTILEPEKIMQIILTDTSTQINAHHASIMLLKEYQPDSLTTYIREKELSDTRALDTSCRSIAGWVSKYDNPLLENDVLNDHRFEGLQLISDHLQSALAVPLKVKGEIIGVIVYQNLKGQPFFTDNHLRIISIIAVQSAQVIINAQIHQNITHENAYLRQQIEKKYQFKEIIGESPAMNRVFDLLERIIPTDVRVVLQGETGTGKELLARAIHFNGPRKNQKFLAIDCGAIPDNLLESELFGHKKGAFTGAAFDKKGLFVEADKGTLFLDEINNLNITLQAKLLRAIQTGEIRPIGANQAIKVDVRIITASSQDLQKSVTEGRFREDLYYRLNVVSIKLPPLRERKADLIRLIQHFLQKYNSAFKKSIHGFTSEAMPYLERYQWPGNIRELENLVERVVALASDAEIRIPPDLLPDEMKQELPSPEISLTETDSLQAVVEAIECKMIKQALQESKGNKTRAAASLGLSRRGLINKLERYKINKILAK